MNQTVNGLAICAWLAVAVGSIVGLFRYPSAMAALGSLLSAAAPLAFVLLRGIWHDRLPPEAHPVLISAMSGLGAVMAMVAVHRFGDQYEVFVAASALALISWLAWVRFVWRAALNRNE